MNNKEYIWQWLQNKINNSYGTAGLMGNLLAESNFNPKNLQNSYEKSLGYTDETYTQAVDDESYSRDQFIHDAAGYGLAQWTYWSRKAELYDYTKLHQASIGNLNIQLEFMWQEINKNQQIVKTLQNATSVREASDIIILKYEKPADQSEQNQIRRANLGQKIYDQYAEKVNMRNLIIYKRLFYNSRCYQAATKQTPIGVQVHSTGAANSYLKRYVQPDDGRLGKNTNNNDHNHPSGDVCASAYIGRLENGEVAVYQTLPWNYRCWLSGSGSNGNANTLGYLGFEVCEDNLTNKEYFEEAVMNKAVLLTAYWCQEFGINVDEYVRDHHELNMMGLASNHKDITHWLEKFGYTMNDFRSKVKEALKDGIFVTIIDCDDEATLFQARAVNPGTYLNIRTGKGTKYSAVGKIPQGEICDVIDNSDSEWWKIRFRGTVGYVMAQYLEKLPEVFEEDKNTSDDIINDENNETNNDFPAIKDTVEIPLQLALELYHILDQQLNKI